MIEMHQPNIIYVSEMYSHANWKSTDKKSFMCIKSILKISHSNYL